MDSILLVARDMGDGFMGLTTTTGKGRLGMLVSTVGAIGVDQGLTGLIMGALNFATQKIDSFKQRCPGPNYNVSIDSFTYYILTS